MAAAITTLALAAPARAGTSSFDEVWDQIASDPYVALPHIPVTLDAFYQNWHDHLTDAAKRTLAVTDDLLPRFDKLLHPNGICLRGTWHIDATTPYTGYFATGSRGLFIGRASTALTPVRRGEYRAFGFAGKIFPTLDPDAPVTTGNFFAIDDLGGTLTDHFLDAPLTNDIIHITIHPSSVFQGPLATAVVRSFLIADQTLDVTQTLIRQLYPVSTLGVSDPRQAVTPTWLKITGAADVARVDRDDFRDELQLANYPDGLAFEIWAADKGSRLGSKDWHLIGRIDVDATVASDSCDHRLHFPHPPYRQQQP